MTVADSSLAVTQTNKNEPDGVLEHFDEKVIPHLPGSELAQAA